MLFSRFGSLSPSKHYSLMPFLSHRTGENPAGVRMGVLSLLSSFHDAGRCYAWYQGSHQQLYPTGNPENYSSSVRQNENFGAIVASFYGHKGLGFKAHPGKWNLCVSSINRAKNPWLGYSPEERTYHC